MAKKKGLKKTTKKAAAKTTAKKKVSGKVSTQKASLKKKAVVKSKTKPAAAKSAAKSATTKTSAKSTASSKVSANAPQVGQAVPDFSAASTSGTDFQLSQAHGRPVVLYFYPKDATPGCTVEGHDFTNLLPEFQKAQALVFGISRDTLKSHAKFKEKECFSFDLLSDPNEELCGLFDVVKEKSLYGRKYLGIERSTFLIDAHGRLAFAWRGVKVPGHAQEVLEKLRSLT